MLRTTKSKIYALTIGLVIIAVMIFGAFAKIKTLETSVKLTSSDFKVGAISVDNGKVIESKQAFYTEELHSIEDAEIKVNEDTTVSYKVFFYDEDKVFLTATDYLTADFTAEDIVEGAKYFRVMVIPAPIDGEPVVCELLNRGRYVNQLTIVVAK